MLNKSDFCSVGFVLEDGSGLEDEAGDVHIDIPMDNYSPDNGSKGKDELRASDDVMVYSLPADTSFQEPQIDPNDEQAWPPSVEPGSHAHGISTIDFSSPASISDLTKRHENASHGHLEWPSFGLVGGGAETSPAGSLQTPSDTLPLPKPSRREAFLLHHFVRKLAPWVNRISECWRLDDLLTCSSMMPVTWHVTLL